MTHPRHLVAGALTILFCLSVTTAHGGEPGSCTLVATGEEDPANCTYVATGPGSYSGFTASPWEIIVERDGQVIEEHGGGFERLILDLIAMGSVASLHGTLETASGDFVTVTILTECNVVDPSSCGSLGVLTAGDDG